MQALRKTFPAVARLPPQEWESLFGSGGLRSGSSGRPIDSAAATGNTPHDDDSVSLPRDASKRLNHFTCS
jgi:hypothetical protein